jgi:hypothetical protein
MRVRPLELFVLATAVVICLVLLSDPSPPSCTDLAAAQSSGGTASVICRVVAIREKDTGWTMDLTDARGGVAQAFLSRSLGQAPPSTGAVVELVLEPSDRPGFFFILSFVTLEPSK